MIRKHCILLSPVCGSIYETPGIPEVLYRDCTGIGMYRTTRYRPGTGRYLGLGRPKSRGRGAGIWAAQREFTVNLL